MTMKAFKALKNTTEAGGENQRAKKKLPKWSSFCDRSRWSMFLHSRLWLGLLPAAAFGFCVVFLVAIAGGFDPASKSLFYGSLAGAMCGLSWAVGIWVALGPDEEDEEDEDEVQTTAPTLFGRIAAWLWVAVLLFILLAFSDVMNLIDGTESGAKAAVSIVSKSLMLLTMGVSVAISLRRY